MKKNMIIILFISIFFGFFWIIQVNSTIPTITYFPINTGHGITDAQTEIIESEKKDEYEWSTFSKSDLLPYLRQDLSLLFQNGRLIGIMNKWEQARDSIEQRRFIHIKADSILQALSFHYGEIHQQDEITSIQKMTRAQAYILKGKAFLHQEEAKQVQQALALEKQVTEQLHRYWNELMESYGIPPQAYLAFPLVDLAELDHYLPESLDAATILGQLWEGLYKNYLLQALEEKANDYMPVILLAKDFSHILVLYRIHGQADLLIQHISQN